MESWAADAREALESGRDVVNSYPVIQALQLGDITIVSLPGEVFAEIGLDIKKELGGKVMVLGYSNVAEMGYIPNAEQYDLGGHEVTTSPKNYGLFLWVPETGAQLVRASVQLVRSVRR